MADFRGDYSQNNIREYMLYGGLPQVVLENDAHKKVDYLEHQMEHTYLRDIKERYDARQELASLHKLRDGFRRIVIVNGIQPTYMNEDGIYIINLMDFLQNPERFIGGITL